MLENDRRSKEKVELLEVYTDGSSKSMGAMRFGGWGYMVIQHDKCIHADMGSEYMASNQRMELFAVLKALEYAGSIRRPSEKVILYSDSAYFINCYNQGWYHKWLVNEWTNSKGDDVANRDLWERIIPFFDRFWYTFVKVKGHANVYWNEQCDELAQSSADLLKRGWKGLKNYGK